MAMKELNGTPMSNHRDTLDVLIQCAQTWKLFEAGHESNLVKIGLFEFRANSHDTGCGVSIWIVLPGEQPRQIVSRTYWYSSSYCFNKQRVENGSWDKALDEAIELMRAEVAKEKERREQMKRRKDFELQSQQNDEKSDFEARFQRAQRQQQEAL
jgi:hypothetical protein